MEGAPAGTMMAPPLAGSPRVQAHRDYIIKVLLRGLTGPLDGKTYRDVMVPMDNTDEWIASIASYVRTSFGNTGDLVTPADVARVRAQIAAHKGPWTAGELEASLPRVMDSLQFTLTASDNAEAAAGAATLRGWTSGVPQNPGMWFQIALPQPATVTEVQFDSVSLMGGRGAGARGAAPAGGFGRGGLRGAQAAPEPGRGGAAPSPLAVGYPRAYELQVSMDGKKWAKVAEGRGEGSRTTITFPPVQAKFLRINQTDNVPDAPPWSVRDLRVYEERSAPGPK